MSQLEDLGERPEATAASASQRQGASEVGGWSTHSIYTLTMLTFVYAFNYFDRLLISMLFPLFQDELGISDSQYGLLTGVVFVLVYATTGIPIARLADRWNRKAILGIGFFFWSLMTALTGFATGFWHMAVTRFMMGAGEAAATPQSTSILTDLFNPLKRPVAFSIMVSGTAISSMVLTPLAGWAAEAYGWREVYWVAGGVGMVIAAILLLTVREPARDGFMQHEPSAPESPAKTAGDSQPGFSESVHYLIQRKSFIYITLSASLLIISFFAYTYWGTTFLLRVHGISVAESAAKYGPVRGIFGLAGGLSGGVILAYLMRKDSRWQYWLPAICFALVGLGQYLYLYTDSHWLIGVGTAIDSFAVTMAVPLISLMLVQIMPPKLRSFGMASYILANSLLGDIMGPFAVGYLNDQLSGIWGEGAIRYSMSITAFVAIAAAPVMVLAGKHLQRDIAAAKAWSERP